MSCPSRDKLHLYLGQGLPEEERRVMARHLETCAACRQKLGEEQQRLDFFHQTLTRYGWGEPSRLRIEDVLTAVSLQKPKPLHQQFWLRTAALVVFLMGSLTLINRFYPLGKETRDAQAGQAMVINPLLDEEPALTIAISTGLCADEAPIFWLDIKK